MPRPPGPFQVPSHPSDPDGGAGRQPSPGEPDVLYVDRDGTLVALEIKHHEAGEAESPLEILAAEMRERGQNIISEHELFKRYGGRWVQLSPQGLNVVIDSPRRQPPEEVEQSASTQDDDTDQDAELKAWQDRMNARLASFGPLEPGI